MERAAYVPFTVRRICSRPARQRRPRTSQRLHQAKLHLDCETSAGGCPSCSGSHPGVLGTQASDNM